MDIRCWSLSCFLELHLLAFWELELLSAVENTAIMQSLSHLGGILNHSDYAGYVALERLEKSSESLPSTRLVYQTTWLSKASTLGSCPNHTESSSSVLSVLQDHSSGSLNSYRRPFYLAPRPRLWELELLPEAFLPRPTTAALGARTLTGGLSTSPHDRGSGSLNSYRRPSCLAPRPQGWSLNSIPSFTLSSARDLRDRGRYLLRSSP
jgi:hypothetical protein